MTYPPFCEIEANSRKTAWLGSHDEKADLAVLPVTDQFGETVTFLGSVIIGIHPEENGLLDPRNKASTTTGDFSSLKLPAMLRWIGILLVQPHLFAAQGNLHTNKLQFLS
jgi:hypothetical protein